MDGAVLVTFAAIEEAAAQTGTTNRVIQTLLEDLSRRLLPMAAEWTGAAAEGFQYQHRLWTQAADDLNTVLGHISALLLDSHGSYVSAEAAAARLWSE